MPQFAWEAAPPWDIEAAPLSARLPCQLRSRTHLLGDVELGAVCISEGVILWVWQRPPV